MFDEYQHLTDHLCFKQDLIKNAQNRTKEEKNKLNKIIWICWVAVYFPAAHIQGTKMIKRNLHFKAPLVFREVLW